MSAPYRIRLYLDGQSSIHEAVTETGALALCRAFAVEHAGNREAWTDVLHLDGSNAGIGRTVHSWWGGERFGPKDTRHPAELLFRDAVRSGARVTVIADGDCWEFGDDRTEHRRAA